MNLQLIDEKDTLIPLRIGIMSLPSPENVLVSFKSNEDLESLMIKRSEFPLSETVLSIISDMLDNKTIAYKNNLTVNHLLRANLIVANLCEKFKERQFELKKEIGNSEVNIYIDEFGISKSIDD